MCTSFCGQGKACCRRRSSFDPVECKGSTGFVDFAYTKGSSADYHQCVQPGPAVAFTIEKCGEFDLNGVWVRNGFHGNRPRYTLADKHGAIMIWSPQRNRWQLQKGLRVLFAAKGNSSTFPTSGWRSKGGASPVPQIDIFKQSTHTSLLQETVLEGSLLGKRSTLGTHEAMCDVHGDLEKIGHWCVLPCPSGYRAKNANTCVQLCGGDMPADSWGMCGTSPQEVQAVIAERAVIVLHSGIKSFNLISDMNRTGVDGDKLARTINAFVEMGKPFAHPRCRESIGAKRAP